MQLFGFWNSISRKVFISMAAVAFLVTLAAFLLFVMMGENAIDRALMSRDNAWKACVSRTLATV